jgi:hypothetical protein
MYFDIPQGLKEVPMFELQTIFFPLWDQKKIVKLQFGQQHKTFYVFSSSCLEELKIKKSY